MASFQSDLSGAAELFFLDQSGCSEKGHVLDSDAALHHVGSIENLPSVRKLRSEVAGLDFLGMLAGNTEAREMTKQLNAELDRIVDVVDKFYQILGDRNWVFFDALNLERMNDVVSKPSPDDAERELISYLKEKETLKWMITRLNRFPDMRPRLTLLRNAEKDYLEGRYYSSVLVTVSAMDGFVNDVFRGERRGLHAREADEMYVEDCIAAVWEGLPSVQKAFTKSVHKRIDEPVFDVYRHVLMHGMATDFDNEVIASKAWCMLFAIGDWAEARKKSQDEPDAPMTLREALSEMAAIKRKNAEEQEKLDRWHAHTVDLSNPEGPDLELVSSYIDFFDAWVSENYGKLGSFFPNHTNQTPNALAGEARECYSLHPISRYRIMEIERPAPATAEVKVEIYSNNEDWMTSLRFVRLNGKDPAAEWDSGEWKLIRYAIDPFRDMKASYDESNEANEKK